MSLWVLLTLLSPPSGSSAVADTTFAPADSSSAATSDSIPGDSSPTESSDAWAWAASLTGYFGSSRDPYAVPVLGVEFRGLYAEMRYNYEDFETGSIFLGWHFSLGDENVGADITPLFGAVIGRTEGVAPAFLLDVALGRLLFHNELEYVVLSEASSESFVYGHSELSYTLRPGLSLGLVGERSKTLVSGERDFVPGLLFGVEQSHLSAVFYLFYPSDKEAIGAIELDLFF